MNIFEESFKPGNRRLRDKTNALNAIVYSDNMTIDKLSDVYFEKLKNAKNICIIGNGPVTKNITHLIDKFDVIIRFNNYKVDTDTKLVGDKTDVQFVCLQIENTNSWVHDCDCVIIFEINRPQLTKRFTAEHAFIKTPKEYIDKMKRLIDMTRGFYTIATCLQIKEKYNKDLGIYIIGFGGEGHHFNKNHHISHYFNEEKVLIDKLKKQKSIVDLKDIDCNTITFKN
tara:strand:+ start:589 stop:1269 length:681 start_codon:yes stop_codon:yes gene_type:complete